MFKLQDVLFFLLLGGVFYFRKVWVATLLGLACLILAMPLFVMKILFTAERLTWYAAAFFLYAVLKQMYEDRH